MKEVIKPQPELEKNMSRNLKYLAYYGKCEKHGMKFVDDFLTILKYVCAEKNVNNREDIYKTLRTIFNKYLGAYREITESDSYYITYTAQPDYIVYVKADKLPSSIENRLAKLADKIREMIKKRIAREDEKEEVRKDASVKKICEQLDEFSL